MTSSSVAGYARIYLNTAIYSPHWTTFPMRESDSIFTASLPQPAASNTSSSSSRPNCPTRSHRNLIAINCRRTVDSTLCPSPQPPPTKSDYASATGATAIHLLPEWHMRRTPLAPSPHLHTVASMLPPLLLPDNYIPYVSDLAALEPASLLQRPEGVCTFLFQALHTRAARCHWGDPLWKRYPDPSSHSAASIRLRARRNSILATGATQLLTAHPYLESHVSSAVWYIMLRRCLGLAVYDDSAPRLTCPHCQSRMDHPGDHSSIYKSGFGVVHRHSMVRNVFARKVFRPAGISAQLEAPLLIPGITLRPADVLVQPPAPLQGTPLCKLIAYNITVGSPYTTHTIRRAAPSAAGVATFADDEKLRAFERAVRGNLSSLTRPQCPISVSTAYR